MKLGINGWRIHGQRTGVGRYLLNVVKNWTPDKACGRFDEINFYTPKPLDRQDIPLPENIRERVIEPNWRMLVWENLRMAPVADDDVIFCPSYTRPLLARGKTVVTTHDVNVRMFPELFPPSARVFYDRLYCWSARRAVLVLTTSDAARQAVAHCYGVPLERIRVVHLAPAEIFRPLPDNGLLAETREQYLRSSAPFFLFVGKLTARRNVPKLIKAFAELKHRTSLPHKLLVIGLNTSNLNITALADELGVSNHVVHRDYVSDEDLNLLYNAAETFIMPSTFEILSLPVMEAQATGTPVVTIDTPGLRETTGGAAFLMSKADVPEMVEAMSRLASDAALRRELAERGLISAQRFSWQRCSAETLAVLEEATELPHSSQSWRASEI